MSKKSKRKSKLKYLPIVVLNNQLPSQTKAKPRRRKLFRNFDDLPISNSRPDKDTVVYIQNYPPPGSNRLQSFMQRSGTNNNNMADTVGLHSESMASYQYPVASASSYGHGGCGSGGCGGQGLSLLEALIFAGALAAAVYFLNTQITMFIGRRRKRIENSSESFSDSISNFFHAALEDFENKIDAIAGNVDKDPDSWLNKLYKTMRDDTRHEPVREEEGLEPPMLDATWGLNEDPLNEGEKIGRSERSTSSVEEEKSKIETLFKEGGDGANCSSKFLRCASVIAQDSFSMGRETMLRSLKEGLYRIVFHGKAGVWNAIMQVPEAQKLKLCLNAREDCQVKEILMRELPAENDDAQKHRRLIVNTELGDESEI